MAYDDVITRNDNDELAVRTVSATESANSSTYDDIYARTDDGKLALRVVGGTGGGGSSTVHTDSTLKGNGTSSNPLGLSDSVKASVENAIKIYDDELPDPETMLGKVALYLGGANNEYQQGYYYIAVEESDEIGTAYAWKPLAIGNSLIVVGQMPVADDETLGDVVMYTGESNENYTKGYIYQNQTEYSDASATITQTVGNSLSDLSVSVADFETAEQPTESGNTSFVANETQESLSPTVFTLGDATITVVASVFLPMAKMYAYTGDWNNVVKVSLTYNGIEWAVGVYDQNDNSIGNAVGISLEFWGVFVDGTPVTTGLDLFLMNYSPAGFAWTKNGAAVDLSEYGISYSGTPSDGDTLTVTYTAPVATGYKWQQINVQPASKSTSIEWKTTVDLPGNYAGDTYQASPYYTIQGGLPDGTYEFYFATKTSTDTSTMGEVIFKVKMTVDNVNNTVYGRMGYVFDGDYMGDGNNVFGSGVDFYSWFNKNGDDFIIYSPERPFSSAVLSYNNHESVPECFRLSAIKNVATGTEYIADGAINLDGSMPQYTSVYESRLILAPIVSAPYIPQYHINNQWEYNDSQQYIRLQPYRAISLTTNPAACSELDVVLVSDAGGRWHCNIKNGYDTYTARILEASGDLANVQIGWNESGDTFLFFNTESGTSGTVYAAIGVKGSRDGVSGWPETPSSFTPATITKIGMTVTTDVLGMIEQYTGETDANYTNGYFYRASGQLVNVPASVDITEETQTGTTITMDADGFVEWFVRMSGWAKADIESYVNSDDPMWTYDANANTLTWSPYGQLPSGWETYFTFSPTPDGVVIWRTSNYTAGHQVVQNGAWERVDVQPIKGTYSDGANSVSDSDSLYYTFETSDPHLSGYITVIAQTSAGVLKSRKEMHFVHSATPYIDFQSSNSDVDVRLGVGDTTGKQWLQITNNSSETLQITVLVNWWGTATEFTKVANLDETTTAYDVYPTLPEIPDRTKTYTLAYNGNTGSVEWSEIV